jgi:hypothetical protein
MPEQTLLQALRWRLTNGSFFYLNRLVVAVGAVLALTYLQLAIVYSGGENPWSLLAPVLAVPAIACFVVGWAHARPLPYLLGIVLALIGGVVPFALIG